MSRKAIFLSFALLAPAIARAQEPPPAADPPRLSLVDAVNRALARNPTAVVAYAEIRRAEALVEETRSSALPTLYGYGTYTRLDADRVLAGMNGPVVISAANQLSANLTLTVPIAAPKPWAQWSHANDNVDATRASAADVKRTLAVTVARAYLVIVAQKRVIDAATRARDTDKAHYDFAHQRLIGGVGNRIDEVRAEQQLQSDEANVQQQWSALARGREALGVLVGVGGAVDAEEPSLQAPTDMASALQDAERRSDVVAADIRLQASQHVVRDDWTDYSPYLTGIVQPFYQNPATLTQPLTGWQAQLVLTIPIYDGGLRYGQAKERDALRDEAQVQLEATVRQARADVRVAFEEIRRADAALVSARQAGELARRALELAQIAYRAGATTNLEVIDAERTARDAETAVAIAEDAARQARLDVLSATGRFP
jgi:outer membrane protein TolC